MEMGGLGVVICSSSLGTMLLIQPTGGPTYFYPSQRWWSPADAARLRATAVDRDN